MNYVLITGADRGLGLSLCKEYLNRGWTVFAGKFMQDFTLLEDLQKQNNRLHILMLDMRCEKNIKEAATTVANVAGKLDKLISNAALMGEVNCELYKPPMELERVWDSFHVNALAPLQLVEAFLPLLEKGEGKRLCFVSSEVACITLMPHRYNSPYPYPMSKAAMNMGIRIMHNELYAKGYTFRLFHPGWMKFRNADGTLGETALFDPDDIGEVAAKYFEKDTEDEHRLVMVDYKGYEWPW